jgi:membrane-associated HD superfamily phosphohydrolase
MSDNSAERIGGWLLGPLAWLIVQLISVSVTLFKFATVLFAPQTLSLLKDLGTSNIVLLALSFISFIAMWYYTLWLTFAFFKRRSKVPKHYIIWLMVGVLLAVKAFAFSPIADDLAVRQLLLPLLAAALIMPYLKRSTRVKRTFTRT